MYRHRGLRACVPHASVRAAPGDTERSGGGSYASSWRGKDSNLRRLSHLIYSQAPLTAREPRQALAETSDEKSSDSGAARVGSAAVAWTQVLAGVAQPLRLGPRLELLHRVVLDLADPLASDVERAADLLERPRPAAGEAEAHLDDLALALRQRRQRAVDVLLAEVLRRDLERRLGRLVLDEVAELGLVLLADRLLERDRLLGHAQDVAHLARRALE